MEPIDDNLEAPESSPEAVVEQEVQPEVVETEQSEQVEETVKEEPPFNEHPRWQEMQQELRELRAKVNEPRPEPKREEMTQDDLLEEMRQVNPTFAKRYEEVEAKAKQFDEFRSEYKADKANELRSKIESKIETLHAQNKVPEFLKPAYRAELDRLGREALQSGRTLDLKDLPDLYSKVHSSYDKQLAAYRKEISKDYIKAKRSDTSSPTPRSAPVERAPAPKENEIPEGQDPREWIKHQVVSSALAKSRGDME